MKRNTKVGLQGVGMLQIEGKGANPRQKWVSGCLYGDYKHIYTGTIWTDHRDSSDKRLMGGGVHDILHLLETIEEGHYIAYMGVQ